MGALDVTGLTFTYPGCEEPALLDVRFSVASGDFVVVCGRSGSGKSTLLRHMKASLAPHGERTGGVAFFGTPIEEVDERRQAAEIAFVLQDPDSQFVCDTVAHELAFGLENLGVPGPQIRLRVAEMASFFGIQDWFDEEASSLSGGQKQLVNLAAVMVLQPRLIVLDEPTAQLDPMAATEFFDTLRRINRELGTTVVLSEQRLEEALPWADRVLALEGGRVLAYDEPRTVCRALAAAGSDMFQAMPTAARVCAAVEGASLRASEHVPLTVRDGRSWLVQRQLHGIVEVPEAPRRSSERPMVELREVWFRYEKGRDDVLRGCTLAVDRGSWHCIVGANGAGKSTMLGVVAGLDRPYRGKVLVDGRPVHKIPARERYKGLLGVMPQNPQALFVERTVGLDVGEMLSPALDTTAHAAEVRRVCELVEIEHLLDKHPFDLSGGEQQRVALAKILLQAPRVLLLDEPTKGLDAPFKRKLAQIIHRLQDDGVTIIMVSHDIEFCARNADACSLMFAGEIVHTALTRSFFAGNSFYTTAANRMARGIVPAAIIDEDVIRACQIR